MIYSKKNLLKGETPLPMFEYYIRAAFSIVSRVAMNANIPLESDELKNICDLMAKVVQRRV